MLEIIMDVDEVAVVVAVAVVVVVLVVPEPVACLSSHMDRMWIFATNQKVRL